MRVLFLAPLPPPVTGQAMASLVLAEGLRQRHELSAVYLGKQTLTGSAFNIARLRQVAGTLGAVWKLRRACDVVYLTLSRSFAGNLRDLLLIVLSGMPLRKVVGHVHGRGLRRLLTLPLLGPLNRAVLRRFSTTILLGDALRDELSGIVDGAGVHVVENCVADEMWLSPGCIDEKFRDYRTTNILFCSNFLEGKGHRELLAAAAQLAPEVRDRVHFDFVGMFDNDGVRASVEQAIGALPNATFHGVVTGSAKVRLFSASHLFCLPTYYPFEGQPISVLEAYAAGCAVITTGHAGIPDIFADGVNGYLVEARSVDSLRAAIERAVAGRDAIRAFAKHNRETAERRFTKARYVAQIEGLLREAAGNAE